MAWVILCTVLSYAIVNLPLIYSLMRVHGLQGTMTLWGYAPNQFLFLVLVFPFAAFCTFTALFLLISRVRPEYPPSYLGRRVLEQWPAAVLVGLIVVAALSLIVYFYSAMSLDKLRPEYARRAIHSASMLEERLAVAKAADRDQLREELVISAKTSSDSLQLSPTISESDLRARLAILPPEGYLRLVQRPAFQLRLNMVDSTLHALNIFQLFVALLTAICLILAAILCYVSAKGLNYSGTGLPNLKAAIDAVYYGVFFFALYPIFFHQYRAQIDPLVGPGVTVLQDILAAGMVIFVLLGLNSIDAAHRTLSVEAAVRLIPALLIGSGFAVERWKPEVMQQLIGKDTNVGTQIILILLGALLSLIPVAKVWPS